MDFAFPSTSSALMMTSTQTFRSPYAGLPSFVFPELDSTTNELHDRQLSTYSAPPSPRLGSASGATTPSHSPSSSRQDEIAAALSWLSEHPPASFSELLALDDPTTTLQPAKDAMFRPHFLLPLLALLLTTSEAIDVSSIIGTWSTGSGAVLTGSAFGDPTASNSFNYPSVAGYSWSFTDDGYFEQASFTWVSNATEPHCVQAQILWQHGTYTKNENGTISTNGTAFAPDGRMQIQDACAANSSVISYYNEETIYSTWAVSEWKGKTMLQLSQYDGTLLPRAYLVSESAKDPSAYMFPTYTISNTTSDSSSRFARQKRSWSWFW
ncbi:hypothetical protein MNV49_004306 [Pseudohyphozyma bogoriensis]|nr:hypothetical protein MNV49_004306 [Pseudohyphozyma bogoriensis]